jgi:hypothetical protein
MDTKSSLILIFYLLQSFFGTLMCIFIFYFFIKNRKWYIQYGLTFIFASIMIITSTAILLSLGDKTSVDVISIKYILMRTFEYIFVLICLQIIHKLIKIFKRAFNKPQK